MRKFFAIFATFFAVALMLPTSASADHDRRYAGKCSCGQSVYQVRVFAGYDSCRRPVYRWVTQSHNHNYYMSRKRSSSSCNSHSNSRYSSRSYGSSSRGTISSRRGTFPLPPLPPFLR